MAAKDEKLKQLLEKLSRGEISVTRITPEHIDLNAKFAAMEKQYSDTIATQIKQETLISAQKDQIKTALSQAQTAREQTERIEKEIAQKNNRINDLEQYKEDFMDEREPSGTVVKIIGNVIAPIIIIIFAFLYALSIASYFVEIMWTESTVFNYIRYAFAALSLIGVCLIVIPCAKGHPSNHKRTAGIISVFLLTLLASLIVNELLTHYWYFDTSEPLDFIHSRWFTIILIVTAVVIISLISSFVVYNSVQERNYLKFPSFFRIVCIVLAVLVVSVGEGYILNSWINSQSSYDVYNVYNNGYYYSYNDDDTLTIVSYDGNSEDLIIPDEYSGSAVTAIKANAFSGNTSLESVIIGGSIITIGDAAFSGCIMLTNVTIGEGVSYIGDSAFENCYKLVEINNLSSLVIRAGSSGNGGIGYYAKNVYTATEGESHLLTQDGCLFVYDSHSDYYLIGYSDSYTTLTLPDLTVSGSAIDYSIYMYAFYNNVNLIKVTISDSVTTIGEYAFYNCSSLENVVVPDSVITIGSAAFGGCSSLESLTLPFAGGSADATTASSSTLFGYIFGTTSYTGGASTEQYYESDSFKTYYIPTNLTEVTITGGDIIYGVFYNCSSLTNINIPEGVTVIGESAFYNCSALDSVNIPKGVTSIGERAFGNCSLLTEVIVPDSVTTIGSAAFGGCSSLESLTLPFAGGSASATTASSSTLFGYIFGTNSYTGGTSTKQYYESDSYTTYYIPVSLTEVTITGGEIFYGAFYNCSALTNVVLSAAVTSVGNYAFCSCDLLVNLTIGEGVVSIGDYAFRYCYKLVEVQNLSSLTITAGSTDNGYAAYYAKNVYTATSGQSNLINQGEYDFVSDGSNYYLYNYSGTDSDITLPSLIVNDKSVNYEINQYAFNSNANITSVTIGNGVTSIGNYAFYYCSSLVSVIIPDSVTAIGHYAFEYCRALKSVTLGYGLKSIGYCAFLGTSLTEIVIPDSVTSIYFMAFYRCTSLTSITIGSGVTSIGNRAFEYSTLLSSVYYNGTVDEWSAISFNNEFSNPTYYGATLYYYAENDGTTTTAGNYWYYNDSGEVVVWTIESTAME